MQKKPAKLGTKLKTERPTVQQPTLYLQIIWDDVEPEIRGPYATDQLRDAAAKEIVRYDLEQRNGLFRLNLCLLNGRVQPVIDAFAGDETETWLVEIDNET